MSFWQGSGPESSTSSDQHKQKTHRPSAWGVLGSTTDGLPFLLTHPVVFRSISQTKPIPGKKSRPELGKFPTPPSPSYNETYSGMAGGRAAMSSAKRGSLRSSANSASLYTSPIPL